VAVVLHGRSASEAARIYGDSPRAVAYWVTRFKQSGIAGLRSEPKPGRPAALSKRNRDILRAAMSRRKKELKPVTARVIAQYIKRRFNVEVTERHCFRILKQLRT
jgi:transposase